MNRHGLINAALFQATWFAAVLGGAPAAAAACGLLFAHTLQRGSTRADVTLAAIAGAIGLGLDTLWIYSGVLDYRGSVVAPPWIVALWIAVGASINHSLSWFRGRGWVTAAAAACSCPLSYLSGAAFGAVAVPQPSLLALVAVGWAVVFGALLGVVAPWVNRQFGPAP